MVFALRANPDLDYDGMQQAPGLTAGAGLR